MKIAFKKLTVIHFHLNVCMCVMTLMLYHHLHSYLHSIMHGRLQGKPYKPLLWCSLERTTNINH